MSVLRGTRARGPKVRLGRRTYLRAGERKRQILDVARKLFATKGYHAANIEDVCKAAGIARGTLYQYFLNKRELMLAVMEDVAKRVEKVLDERPRLASIPGIEKVPVELMLTFCKKRLREILDAVFIDEHVLRLMLRDARGIENGIDRVIAHVDEQLLRALVMDLKIAQKAGLLREGDPRMIGRYILGGIEKMVLGALGDDEKVDLDTIVDTAVEIEMFGILSPRLRQEVSR